MAKVRFSVPEFLSTEWLTIYTEDSELQAGEIDLRSLIELFRQTGISYQIEIDNPKVTIYDNRCSGPYKWSVEDWLRFFKHLLT
jgi:hypothetical protein